MKKKFWLATNCILLTIFLFAQTEKFDIATFIPPPGWQRMDTAGSIAFVHSKNANGLFSFCQIILYASTNSNGSADKNFKTAWNNLVTVPSKSKLSPVTETSKTPDGWTVVTGAANITNKGLNYNSMVTTISGFGKTMNIQVNLAGNEYADIIQKFFDNLDLDSKAVLQHNLKNKNNQSMTNVSINLNDFDFITPEGWQLQKNKDYLLIQNMQSGCVIRILSQPSSGDLEKDANAVFDIMYAGWNYQKSGSQQYVLSKGFLTKGLEYCMKEATMSVTTADGRYSLEDGSALIVKAGNQIAIISVRHNSSTLGHDDCYKNYNTLARFFNSFSIKHASVATNNGVDDAAKRIIGLWKIVSTGVVTGDYVFAANGNYQHGGAIGSSTITSDSRYEYIYNRAYPFQGDGGYTVSGNKLTLTKKGGSVETTTVRFEKIRYGNTAWKDRIYMLKKDALNEYESVYEKETK